MKLRSAIPSASTLAILLWLSFSVSAQITVQNQGANALINNVFIGNGVPVLNVTQALSSAQQIGKFNGGLNIIGIDSGVVMSTGNIASIPINGFASTGYFGLGDADVLAVSQSVPWGANPGAMRDRAIIEFDFVAAQSDSVAFEYCFASEEWPNYPCSVFNDAFGFFISGPGVTGPYSNSATNVSLVPGTANLPVAISSVHNGTGSTPCNGNPSFPQFYNDGPVPNPFTFAGMNPGQSFNGNPGAGAFTDVFQTRPVFVNACDTYHVKLAICDGVDWIFDSSVFLKAKSFQFLGITASPSPSYNPFGFDTALYEGCGTLDLDFTRVDTAQVLPPLTISYSLNGTATAIQDYSLPSGCVPNMYGGYDCDITFAQDSTNASVSFAIFNDGFTEGIETFQIIIDDPNVTNCSGNDTVELTILDQPDLQISAFGNTTLDCADDSAFIGVQVLGGLPPFTYDWSSGSQDSAFNVAPPQTTNYTVTVEDGCGQQQEVGFVTVGVFNIPWTTTKFGDKQIISCISNPVDLGVNVAFNDQIWHGEIEYLWSTGSVDSTISVFSTVDTNYSITITRTCTGESVVHDFDLYVYNDPIVTATNDIPLGAIDCPLDTVRIDVVPSGGYPPYSYQWNNGDLDSVTTVSPSATSSYYVTVNDVCGLANYLDTVVVNVPVPDPITVAGIINDTVPCRESTVHFGPIVTFGGYGWGYSASWNDFKDTVLTTSGIIYRNTPFSVKVTDGCRFDTTEFIVHGIVDKNSDLSLALTDDTLICLGDSVLLEAEAKDGGGKYSYQWTDNTKGARRYVKPLKTTTYRMNMTDNCDSVRRRDVIVAVDMVKPDFEFQYLNDYDVELMDQSWATSPVELFSWELVGDAGMFSSLDQNPIIALPDGQPYNVTLEATDSVGCKSTITAVIAPTYRLYIPTGFTPNNDNINDVWSVSMLGVQDFQIEVFDRWGNKVFRSSQKEFTWDGIYNGSRMPMGAYAWKIVLTTDGGDYVEEEGVLNLMNDFQDRQ